MEDKTVLYSSPTCGVCNMIKIALKNAGVEFDINQDDEYMRSQGISRDTVAQVMPLPGAKLIQTPM